MKLQDFLVPAFLAFLTMIAINYFFPGKLAESGDEVRSGQTFKAMPSSQMCQPINTEIDFFDAKPVSPVIKTDVQGHNSALLFSSYGASLDSLIFHRDLNGQRGNLTTIFPPMATEREDSAFLVALNEMTPFYFTLVDQKQDDDEVVLVYQAETSQARMVKEYRIAKDVYKIDLALTLEPLDKTTPIQARIFFPTPYIPETDAGKITGLVYTTRDSLDEVKPADNLSTIWAAPKIFGAQGRYFVNALVGDGNRFVQRAYFKLEDKDKLTAILEGPQITEKTTWNLSFYCGPKEAASLGAVDKRLEGVMGYGWFAPISKLMMYLLNGAYKYVGNYGWAIIILTLLMRILMLPFAQGGEGNMRKKQKDYERKLASLKHRYKDDPEGLAREQMKLFKENNPLSGSGCLMMFVQLPVFLGLNYALRNSIELYRAPFLWISDLSAADPYYIFPTLMGLGLFMTLSERAKDPRKKVAVLIGVLFLIGLLAKLSAGLALYIFISTTFGLAQTKLLNMAKA